MADGGSAAAQLQRDGRPIPVFAFPEDAARALGHAARYGRWRKAPAGRVPHFDDCRADEAAASIAAGARLPAPGGWRRPTSRALLDCYGIRVARMARGWRPRRRRPRRGRARRSGRAQGDRAGARAQERRRRGARSGCAPTRSRRGGGDGAARRRARASSRRRLPRPGDGARRRRADRRRRPGPRVRAARRMRRGRDERRAARRRRRPADAAHRPRRARDAALAAGCSRCSTATAARRAATSAALEELLLRVGALVEAHPEIAEMDLNPVVALADGPIVVDARIRLESPPAPQLLPSLTG